MVRLAWGKECRAAQPQCRSQRITSDMTNPWQGVRNTLPHSFVDELGHSTHGTGMLVVVEDASGNRRVFDILQELHTNTAGRTDADAEVDSESRRQIFFTVDQCLPLFQEAVKKALHDSAKDLFLCLRNVIEPPRAMHTRGNFTHGQTFDALR